MVLRGALLSLLLILGPSMAVGATAPPTPEIRKTMAPTGKLRVALYTGTTTSVRSKTNRRGVGYDMGQELAKRLGVPFEPVILLNNVEVQAAMRAKTADIAFAHDTPARDVDMDFTQTHLAIELGYLAGPKVKAASMADVDKPGVRVGVTVGSSSQPILEKAFKNAKVVTTPTLDTGVGLLREGKLDYFATNKANLGAMQEKLPGSRVLPGSWGVERHAMALPKGRQAAMPYAKAFVADIVANGQVKAAVSRAGLQGMINDKTP